MKIFKNSIFTFVLGLIIAGAIGVIAISVSADDISYGTGTVKDAIDELYNDKTAKLVKIGDYNSLTSHSIDIKSILPNNYQDLTVDNFVFKNLKQKYSNSYNGYNNSSVINSYDNTSGILTLNESTDANNTNNEFMIEYSLYCIYGDFETE